MRPLLEETLAYPNPLYLASRKTEAKKPVLSVFLKELLLAHWIKPEYAAAKAWISQPNAV